MPSPLEAIDVFILCGGFGKRLRSVNPHRPKPMVEIEGRPFLDILLQYLSRFGFRRFVLGTGYKAEVVRDYYRSHTVPGLEIAISQEREPLDTGGAVKNAGRLLQSDPFMVLNGDTLCEFDPGGFVKFHSEKGALVSILLRKAPDDTGYGSVAIDRAHRIVSFNEKENRGRAGLINAGIYIFDKRVIRKMPNSRRFSLERDFFPAMVGERLFGYISSGFFLDIGTPERYRRARRHLLKAGISF